MKIFNKFIWSKKEPSNKNDIWFDGSTWRMYTEEAWQSFTLPVDAADTLTKMLENASEVYQEKLNAGYGIVIEGNTISVDDSIKYDDNDVWEAIETLQQNKVEQIQLNDYVPLDRWASTSQVMMDNISELNSIKLNKTDVATINGKVLTEGGNILIGGGESSHNIGSIDLFEQIIAQKQNYDLTLEDKEAILSGKIITTSAGNGVVPTISINSMGGDGVVLIFHFNERLYEMFVMWTDTLCYINGVFSFTKETKLYADSELSETSENAVQNKVVTEKLAELSAEIGISNLDVFNKYVGEIYAPNVSSSDVATLYIFRIAYFVSGAYYNFMSFRDSNGALLFDFQKSYPTQEEALAAWSGVHWSSGNAFLLKGNPTEPINYNTVPITFTKDFVDSPISIRLQLQEEDIKENKAEIEYVKKGEGIEESLFPSINLFNGEYDEGFWLTSGLNPYSGYYVTKPIKTEGGKSYKYPSNSSSYGSNFPNYAVYDLSGNFVKVKRATTEGAFEILTEESDCFVSVNIGSSSKQRDSFMFAEASQYPTTYQPYMKLLKKGLYVSQDAISSPLLGKILAVDGDSICYGAGYKGGYGKIIAERNGMTLENLGVGGGTIAAETYYKDGEARHWICRSVATLREDADYILVEGGVNDPGNTVSMGSLTYGYNEELDDTTFYGAFESMLKTLITRFAGKKIGYIAVHKMTRQFSSIKKNGENNYYHAAKECCDKWGVPFLDLNDEVPAFGLFPNEGELAAVCKAYTAPSSSNPNVGDGWHPNEEGYKKYYCDKIEAFMLSL